MRWMAGLSMDGHIMYMYQLINVYWKYMYFNTSMYVYSYYMYAHIVYICIIIYVHVHVHVDSSGLVKPAGTSPAAQRCQGNPGTHDQHLQGLLLPGVYHCWGTCIYIYLYPLYETMIVAGLEKKASWGTCIYIYLYPLYETVIVAGLEKKARWVPAFVSL